MKEAVYKALLVALVGLTIFIVLICLTLHLEAYRTHRTQDLPMWTVLLFLAVGALIVWPHFKRD
ncbi:hypothetical protein GCM10028803_00080 [Larkinella knui]|uniref:Uncharacterized protein n=1 Tax=Larkinella knui TaxID=2025310 RepID=A0A3P1CK40_9BACT|nr:hypothetical protein [Larkinella knui]RRB13416.1 hypothetical protein EHT87_14160 [Larkinella knui]